MRGRKGRKKCEPQTKGPRRQGPRVLPSLTLSLPSFYSIYFISNIPSTSLAPPRPLRSSASRIALAGEKLKEERDVGRFERRRRGEGFDIVRFHRLSLYALRVYTGLDPRPTAASITPLVLSFLCHPASSPLFHTQS